MASRKAAGTPLVQYVEHDEDGWQPIVFKDGGKKQKVTYTWFRGDHCNYGPTSTHLEDWEGYRDYFLHGFAPSAPHITPHTRITAFGSCFAANISAWLARRNYQVLNKSEQSGAYVIRMGEGMVHTPSIRQQFEWALEGRKPEVELWHGYDASAFGYDESVRLETRELFLSTDLFILTLGLSEVWYHKKTGDVFWRAIPKDKFDPVTHGFRTIGVTENADNIQAIIRMIRTHVPDAKVIVTLSPIPLVATFRDNACTSSNAVSKASLRMAIDTVMNSDEFRDVLYYWPSYEIVMDGFLGKWMPDRRHVKKPILNFIMSLFEQIWCVGGIEQRAMCLALLKAKAADGSIKASTFEKILAMTPEQVAGFVSRLEQRDRLRLAKTVSLAFPPKSGRTG
jgi:hypothetical protein